MVSPVAVTGAKPRFYPVGADGTPKLDWLQAQDLSQARVLLAAHFFGLPIDFSRLQAFCKQRGIVLIEDCAHAFFGSVDGTPVGSWGRYVIGSAPKFFPVPTGGFLVMADSTVLPPEVPRAQTGSSIVAAWDIAQSAAAHRRLTGLNNVVQTLDGMRRAIRTTLTRGGHGSPSIHAETSIEGEMEDPLLRIQSPSALEIWITKHASRARIAEIRRRNYRLLASLLSHVARGRVLFPRLPLGAVPYVLPIELDSPDVPYMKLRREGAPVFRWDRYWPDAIDSPSDVGRSWGDRVLQVACHQDLTEGDVESIAAMIIHALADSAS